MNLPSHLLLFTLTSAAASMVPGLAVMGSFTTSLNAGFGRSVWFSLGLVTTSVLYFALSGMGLIVLLGHYQFIFYVLKYAGIAYLVYLGLESWRSPESALEVASPTVYGSAMRYYGTGLLLNLANPKNILFFVAVLPQYINLHESVGEQVGWLMLASEIPELLILIMYGWCAGSLKPFLMQEGIARYFNQFIGVLFVGLAILLLML